MSDRGPEDELEAWARARSNWPDAEFRPLVDSEPEMAMLVAHGAVDVLFDAAHLDPAKKPEALEELMIEEGTTAAGQRLIQVSGWYGTTTVGDWDGSREDADDSLTSYALDIADEIEGDRMPYGPHPWDLSTDDPSTTG